MSTTGFVAPWLLVLIVLAVLLVGALLFGAGIIFLISILAKRNPKNQQPVIKQEAELKN